VLHLEVLMKVEHVMGVVTAGLVADALWRRNRAAGLRSLPPSAEPLADTHRFVTVAGVELDEATKRAAVAYARSEGLDVLGLVPEGLDSLRAMELVRRLDPVSYRTARLAEGEGGGHALVVSADVARRAGVSRFGGLSAAELDELAVRLKRYAPTTTDVVVTPGVEPVGRDAEDRRATLRRRWLNDLPTYLSGSVIGLGAFAVGAALGRRWGVAAVAAACAQPYLATLGTPLRPHDRHRFALSRPVAAPYRWLSVAAAPDEPDPELPRLREEFAADLAGGVGRFQEPRRADCPWCGGARLRRLLTSGDLQHHRPGVFRLDRCGSCGHVFQNPRLSDAGLTFYYKEFYDGNGGAEVERGFRLGAPHYRDRARMLRGHAVPRAWLDVGGGHGHFCNAARDVWPETRFDALDMSGSVEEAERQGWVDRGHLGFFPELADELAGAYDVVSMHHYLEHTVDPSAELDAAAKVLPPGGHLLIEVPDPEWPLGRLAGRWWHCWFQPQHLNLVPVGNLVAALAERGLDTVEVHRGSAHQPLDLTMIAMLMVHRLVPDPNKPWRFEPHHRLRVAARTAAFLAGAPLILTAGMVDQMVYPLIRRSPRSNAYRVLARKRR
jgi:SAM-dependent methyltransferase